MKALQKSPISSEHAFECNYLRASYFDPNWHFHPEYQVFIVLKGTGTRFVGDHVHPFKTGDLVLTGPNLPHLWRSDPEYFEAHKTLVTEGIVIYFPEHLFASQFLQTMETLQIRQMLTRSSRGIAFGSKTLERVTPLMKGLLGKKNFDGILQLLSILHMLSTAEDYTLLANPGYSNSLSESDTERMNKVHAYVMKHFREQVTLGDVAAVANMTPSSFSRYFKTHANKTFTEFLAGIRIGYSCKLLIEKEINVSQACYDSGFNTLSNFNRQFKAYMQVTPMEYRNRYLI